MKTTIRTYLTQEPRVPGYYVPGLYAPGNRAIIWPMVWMKLAIIIPSIGPVLRRIRLTNGCHQIQTEYYLPRLVKWDEQWRKNSDDYSAQNAVCILWAAVGVAALVLLIAISVTCSAFAPTFDRITFALLHTLGIAAAATGFAGLLIMMMERGGA